MAQRGGGLYGGIRFSSAASVPPQAPETIQKPVADPVQAAVIEAAPVVFEPAPEVKAQAADSTLKPSAGWSAALAFAPVRRSNKPKPAQTRLPPGAAVVASLTAAASIHPTATIVQPSAEEESVGWAKKLKAPSMVIDDDINGFRGGKSRKKGKKNKNPNLISWDPLDPYDPFHPNDYHEYKRWKQRDKEERRFRERRRNDDLKRRRDSSRSEYSSQSESDNEERRRGRKSARLRSPERDEDDLPRGIGANRPVEVEEEVSRNAVQMQAESGEEAYLRRLAMSQGVSVPRPQTPPEEPMQISEPSDSPKVLLPDLAASHPPPPSAFPMPVFQEPPPQPTVTVTPLTQATIEERKKAAAAIAARLSALSKTIAPPLPENQPPSEPQANRDKAGFAARMMAKYGHVEGQGLGANADGIVQPIMLEKLKAPKAGKKADPGEDKSRKPGAGGMGIGGSKMGRIVNVQAEEKNRADIARYGESSRIVVLTNIVSPHDVDDDLQTEIGEECSKHGTVERVVVHFLSPPPADEGEAVRIFVQFSGPAGAWKAVRDLDGRFFGGRTVRARYFDEGNFAKRLFDMVL